jgi:spore coat assembly protein
MYYFKVGDIVSRKSYGNDIHFLIKDILYTEDQKPVYVLKGLLYRIEADSDGSDLSVQNPVAARLSVKKYVSDVSRNVHHRNSTRGFFNFIKRMEKPGTILQIDSSREFLDMCLRHYRQSKIECTGYLADESQQPKVVKSLLERYKPDILVVTGHDGIKKASAKPDSLDNYRNSRYYVRSVNEARKYQPDPDKLCIFAGACQSYFEAIMSEGANFASSPGRVLINALDPAIVCEKVDLTDYRKIVTPEEVAELTISGPKGIGGINTKGRMKIR